MTAAPPPDDWSKPELDAGPGATAARADGRRRASASQPSEAALALLAEAVAFEATVMAHAIRRPALLRLVAIARWRREGEALEQSRETLRDAVCRLPAAQFVPFGRPRL